MSFQENQLPAIQNRPTRFPRALLLSLPPVILIGLAVLLLPPSAAVVLLAVLSGCLVVLLTFQTQREQQKQAHQEILQKRAAELTTLNNLSRSLAGSLHIDELLRSIYEEIRQWVGLTTFYVALLNDDDEWLDYRLVVHKGLTQTWARQMLTNAEAANLKIIKGRKTLRITANGRGTAALGIAPEDVPFAAYLGVPLTAGNQVIGVLGLLHETRATAFTADEIRLLELIATECGVAIRNASMFDISTQLAQKLSIVNRSVQNVVFGLDSDTAIRAACETALIIARAQQAAVYLLDKSDRAHFRLFQQIGLPDEYRAAYSRLVFDSARYQNGAYLIPDVDELTDVKMLEMARLGNFRAMAEIPLRSGGVISGLLVIFHKKPNIYRQIDLELLDTLSLQITAAFDNAELLKALELYAAEQAQLLHLSRITTSSLELETVVGGMAEILRQMLNVNSVWVGLLPESGAPYSTQQTLTLYSALPATSDGDKTLISQQIAFDDLPEVAEIIRQEMVLPRVFQQGDQVSFSPQAAAFMQQHNAASLAVMPLVVNTNLLGVLLLGSESISHFSDSEWQLLEVAANQVATQLHNVRLYTSTREALKRRLEQLALIEEIAQKISSELDFEQVIANVLDAAQRTTQADIVELALLGEDDVFRIIGLEYVDGTWRKYNRTQPQHEGLIARVAQTHKSVLLADNKSDPDYVTPNVGQDALASSLVVPLVRDKRFIGALNVESKRAGAFTEEQSGFLNSLAGHAMISIQNAQLLEDRNYQVSVLTNLGLLSLRLSGTTSVAATAQAVIEIALLVMEGDDAALFHANADAGGLRLMAGMQAQGRGETRIHQHAASRALTTGTTQILRRDELAALNGDLVYETILAAPLKRGGSVQEVLCIGFREHRTLQERERSALDLLAGQAAAHLENAMLQERIIANNNQMRAILDANRDSAILLDPEGRLVDANTSAEELLDLDMEEDVGKNFPALLLQRIGLGKVGNVSETEELTRLARILRLEPERITRRHYELEKNNHTVYIEEVGSPVTDAHHQIIGRLLVLRDISEQAQLAKFREELTSLVIHDLRSPLGAIITGLMLALETIDQEAYPSLVPVLNIALGGGYTLLNLVNSLLDIARWEREEIPLKRERVQLSTTARAAVEMLAPSMQAAEIKLQFDIPDTLPFVLADAELIRRVLINLLDNAMRFTPTKGDILIQAECDPLYPDRLLVRVADSGAGIPPEDRESIFVKFKQGSHSEPTRGHKGSGLGLTFCKLVIEGHGERIWVENGGPLPGASIAFTLPLVQ